ncbi:hypothetical protein WA026_006174 [Henosepilachna vigintioctopunctata]|uniref:Uncharacterized protein n=1 Tax=Henosepilachna vigintioctopunctata TaxID=420089 RepID=A0AAW1TIY0_9CUCU
MLTDILFNVRGSMCNEFQSWGYLWLDMVLNFYLVSAQSFIALSCRHHSIDCQSEKILERTLGAVAMAEDFIVKFHELRGTISKEKKKSLFLLLDSHKSFHTDENILKEINQNLIPKTYLEEIYKLEFLLYFRRTSDLLEVLKNGNDIAASKIIRQPWFIEGLFKDMKSKEFVQNVFPRLSIVVRSKILKQILKLQNDQLINDLFDRLLEIYGLEPAIILLSGCSNDKIKDILLKRGFNLSNTQLKLLHDKDPSLINFYYGEYHKRGDSIDKYSDFSKYLSRKNPSLYIQLLLKYDVISCQLGRRTTKQFVRENKEVILEDPQKYLDLQIFHENAFVSELGEDFQKVLTAALPKNLSDLMSSEVFYLLNNYPKTKRYNLYRTVFEDVYKKSLLENKNFITENLLAVIPDVEEREKWVEKFENQVKYIKYKRSSKAVMELKEQLIRCDNITLRAELLGYIVTSCSINNDYDALLDILELFHSRFRNTDGGTLCYFLRVIYDNIKLNKLTDDHWKYIHEFILIQDIRNLPIYNPILLEFSKYLYKNGRYFGEIVDLYLKSKIFSLRNIKFKDVKFQREFLKEALKQIGSKPHNTHSSIEITLALRDWNKRHPDDLILVSENKQVVEYVKKSIVDFPWNYHASNELLSMKYLVCRENVLTEFVNVYFNRKDNLEDITMTKWFLKYKPDILISEEHIDHLIECFNIKEQFHLMKYLRKYEHLGLVQKISSYYLKKLIDINDDRKDEIAHLLAAILPKSDYLKLLDEYVPKFEKHYLMTASLEEKNVHKIQIALAKSVRFSTCHLDALPILLKYCKSTLFRSSLFSLYSCFNRIPEKTLENVLGHLLENLVSRRKHSIFLAALVFPLKTHKELADRLLENDENNSIKRHLFISIYKYFLKNPEEKFWNILETYMDHLTLYETKSLNLLADVHVIPEKYKSKFMKKVCNVFEELYYIFYDENYTVQQVLSAMYDKLLKSVTDDDMRSLSTDLCIDIIGKKFDGFYRRELVCDEFAIKFLMYATSRKTVRNVLKIINPYKKDHWDTSFSNVTKQASYSIFKNIFNKTMTIEEQIIPIPKNFPSILSEEWKKVFPMDDALEEQLMLDFMILKYTYNEDDENFYAREITQMFTYLRDKYGDLIIDRFKEFLSKTLRKLLGGKNYDIKLMKLLAKMLEIDSSLPNSLLVIQLLPPYQYDREFDKNFSYVMKKVQSSNGIQQVYMNRYFKK